MRIHHTRRVNKIVYACQPVVGTICCGGRRIDVIRDDPHESGVLTQSDVGPIGGSDIRAIGVEVAADQKVLRTTKTQNNETKLSIHYRNAAVKPKGCH